MSVFGGYHVNGVLDAGANVFRLKVGIVVANDVGKAQPFADHFQNVLYRDAGACNAGLAKMNLSVDGDAVSHGRSPDAYRSTHNVAPLALIIRRNAPIRQR